MPANSQTGKPYPAKAKSNEIRIERMYDAPVEAVWDAWTDPAQVAQWWGPRGFTLTTHSKDLRVGGHWTYTMHGPDGTDYENKTLYHEVIPQQKLVYDHGGNEDLDRPPLFRVTATFEQIDDQTRLVMTMAFASPEVAKEMAKFIKQAGGNGTWDRLAEYLEEHSTGKRTFVINRSFAAPQDVVFDMWSKPEHVAQWLPPTGFEMEYLRQDIRPGGSAFYKMFGQGMTMYGRCEYLEIDRPDRLVYKQQFCDEQERLSRHPAAPTSPATMLTTVLLAPEAVDQTRVTVTWEAVGDVTPEEMETFIAARGGMTQGWTGSFDKLEALLQTSPALAGRD